MALRIRRRAAVAAIATTGLVGAGLLSAGTAGAASPTTRHVISPAAAWTSQAGTAATIPSTTTIHAKVWLPARNAAALQQFVAAVSNPSSSSYGHYLSHASYVANYAPTSAQVSAVEHWLTGAGLAVEGVGPDNHFVAVAGSATAIDAAFAAAVRQFTVSGSTVTGPTATVSVPSTVAADVLAVTGLDTLAHQANPDSTAGDTNPDAPGVNNGHRVNLGPAPGFVNAGPCSSYYGQQTDGTDPAFNGNTLPYAVCGYTPAQLRSVYGVTASGLTGKGVTVAITDAFASPTLAQDVNTYASRRGDKAFAGGQFSQQNLRGYDPSRTGACGGGNNWYGEQSLDVEAVHGMAPDAGVIYYGAASCYDDDLMAAMAQAVTDDQASLVTDSWGEPTFVVVGGTVYPAIDDALVAAYDSIFAQAAAQGIGFYFSSGDSGDDYAAWGIKGTDYPTSDPMVTSVGGTSLAEGSSGSRIFETGWGTEKYSLASGNWDPVGFLYGAGGGDSPWFTTQPSYQAGIATTAGRGVPDIAMVADPNTGMLIGETQSFALPTVWGQGTHYGEYRIGGTSLASPLTAGLNADAQQGRSRLGFANPLIYSLANSGVYYDVTPQGDVGNVRVDYRNGLNAANGTKTSVRTFNQDASLTTGTGWDEVTGVGTPTLGYIQAVNAG